MTAGEGGILRQYLRSSKLCARSTRRAPFQIHRRVGGSGCFSIRVRSRVEHSAPSPDYACRVGQGRVSPWWACASQTRGSLYVVRWKQARPSDRRPTRVLACLSPPYIVVNNPNQWCNLAPKAQQRWSESGQAGKWLPTDACPKNELAPERIRLPWGGPAPEANGLGPARVSRRFRFGPRPPGLPRQCGCEPQGDAPTLSEAR
jgi:hypothetical protein